MYKNYFKVAYRNMRRHKLYFFLNITGLSVAIACCLLITIYVKDELSYDRHHEGHNDVYRVITDFKLAHRNWHFAWGPSKMAEYAKTSIPEVVNSGLIRGRFTTQIELGEDQLVVENATYASSGFFNALKIPFAYGNQDGVLDEVGSVVISKSLALRLFNTENAIDKIITWNEDPFLVTGVIEDIPRTSHLQLDMMISNKYRETFGAESWLSLGTHTYLRLGEGVDPEFITAKLNVALNQFIAPLITQNLKIPADQIHDSDNHARFYLQPIKDIHLKTDFSDPEWENGDMASVYTISLIGMIILVVASINFINLSTARASVRGKEVGVRKVLGSQRGQLIQQFLTESVLNSLISFALASIIALAALPYFSQITGKIINSPLGGTPPLWLMLILAALVLGIVAGFYPAFVLSSFKPDKTLKGQNILKMRGSWLRNSLVILQFAASTVLIISAIVITRQLNFVQDKPLGFAKEELLTIEIMSFEVYDAGEVAFENELLQDPRIRSISRTSYVPIEGSRRTVAAERLDEAGVEHTIDLQAWAVSHGYISTIGLEMVSGRGFMEEFVTDSSAIVINEATARDLQLDNPLGEKVKISQREFTIIGVMKDFHYASLKNGIEPLALRLGQDNQWDISVRFLGDPAPSIVKDVWDKHAGGQPFVYHIVSDQYNNLYNAEQKMKLLINGFSVITIFVAAMGLFGLAAFLAEQKKRELGIRKVLGAKMMQLMLILFKSFGQLVVIACIIALPVAFLITKGWLSDFAYRMTLDPGIFIISCMIIFIVAGVAVIYQSIKAASVNPVENLRTE